MLERELSLANALADRAAEIAKRAHRLGITLKQAALELGYLTEAEYDEAVRPERMVRPE